MNDGLITELTDIAEVFVATIAARGISAESVQQIQRQRFVERSGVNKRFKLLWTEEGNEDV